MVGVRRPARANSASCLGMVAEKSNVCRLEPIALHSALICGVHVVCTQSVAAQQLTGQHYLVCKSHLKESVGLVKHGVLHRCQAERVDFLQVMQQPTCCDAVVCDQ